MTQEDLIRSNELLSIQVESQKRQLEELMDWVGTTMKLLEDAQKEIRDLREHVGELYHKGYGDGYHEGVYDQENK